MDGGQIDGQEVMVTMVKPTRGGGPRRHKFDHDSRRLDFINAQQSFSFYFSRSPPPRRGGSPRRGSPGGRKRRGSVGSSTDSDQKNSTKDRLL